MTCSFVFTTLIPQNPANTIQNTPSTQLWPRILRTRLLIPSNSWRRRCSTFDNQPRWRIQVRMGIKESKRNMEWDSASGDCGMRKKVVYEVRRCGLPMLGYDANERYDKGRRISWTTTHATRIQGGDDSSEGWAE